MDAILLMFWVAAAQIVWYRYLRPLWRELLHLRDTRGGWRGLAKAFWALHGIHRRLLP